MSQPNTTSQNPNPPSTADMNLSLCRYLPRMTPSMSVTATFTLPDAELWTVFKGSRGSCPAEVGGVVLVAIVQSPLPAGESDAPVSGCANRRGWGAAALQAAARPLIEAPDAPIYPADPLPLP